MNRATAALGSATFFVLAPGVVAGLVPWLITGYRMPGTTSSGSWVRVLVGLTLVAAGVAVLATAFARFVLEGRGTPAPIAPTEQLVVGGTDRYVRNPMYVAVVAVIAGQALALWSTGLVAYAALVWLTVAAFVRW